MSSLTTDASNGAGANPTPQTQQGSEEAEDTREEWEIQRDAYKATADAAFRSRDFPAAIRSYTDALAVDPSNHILLSNRSAAHLSNSEKSKALADARKCVELKPDFLKGHTRLAAAMMSLGRFSEAKSVYSKVLQLDADSTIAKKGLEDCRAREREAQERDMQRVKMEMEMRAKREREEEEAKKKKEEEEAAAAKSKPVEEGDDLLDDFFSEVENVTAKKKPVSDEGGESPDPAQNSDEGPPPQQKIQIHLSDLGTAEEQIDRLLQPNYEWKNLNPFHVLAVSHNTPEDMLSRRYKALSLLVHPDKCQDDRAKDAFEEVRKAMNILNDADKARHTRALVERGMKQGKRDWEAECAGKPLLNKSEADEGLRRAQEKAVMKIFAEIERTRRDVERRKRKQEQRERAQEDEEKVKEKNERDFEKKWREGNRVESRVGNWRDFQNQPPKKAKKSR